MLSVMTGIKELIFKIRAGHSAYANLDLQLP